MSTFPIPLSPPFAPWQGLVLEEDQALYIAFNSLNLTVLENNGTPKVVKVLWENPQREMDPQFRPDTQGDNRSVAEITYPNVRIQFVDMERDPSREHRNFNQITEWERNSGNPGPTATIDMPIPMLLNYQISANAANIQHMRQLVNVLTFTVLLPRFGVLMCPSGTVRRLDIASGPRNVLQTDREGKRFFRAIWMIQVSSEIEYSSISQTPVEEASLSVTSVTNTNTYQLESFTVTETSVP